MTEELTVDVPLVATGDPPAVDGRVAARCSTRPRRVKVRALPDHLPQSIEYSVESLVDFDAAIHVRDLTIPGDVTLLTDADEIIAKVQAPRVEVEEAPVVAEGEEGAEGEAAEGEAAGGESARRRRLERRGRRGLTARRVSAGPIAKTIGQPQRQLVRRERGQPSRAARRGTSSGRRRPARRRASPRRTRS